MLDALYVIRLVYVALHILSLVILFSSESILRLLYARGELFKPVATIALFASAGYMYFTCGRNPGYVAVGAAPSPTNSVISQR